MSWGAPSPVLDCLESVYSRFAGLYEGEVATYIPELAHADKRWFGICLATTDGQVYEVGDTRRGFTIQSISKPFVYATALADKGREVVSRRVGVEPSGDAFNAISLDPHSGRPANPMINAGAIASTSLLAGDTYDDRLERMMTAFSRYAGRPLHIDEAVYASERDTGFRNFAIAFMLRNFGILEADPEEILDLYFKQCSVLVDCRDLGVMAAMLAGGGVNPVTGERVLDEATVESVLSVMGSCGMYNYAGEWIYSVGLPAKSGVSGGILAVLPGHLGIGVYSPPLDERGNSVRGIAVCRELSRTLGLHLFNVPRAGKSVIHRSYTAEEVSSNRIRLPAASSALRELGRRIRVYDLQGKLAFGTTEVVVRDVMQKSEGLDYVLLDFEAVTEMNANAADLLSTLRLHLARGGKRLVFSHRGPELASDACAEPHGPEAKCLECMSFPDIDHALEWCEDQLLYAAGVPDGALKLEDTATLDAFALFRGLEPEEKETIQRILQPRAFPRGEMIVRAGDQDDSIYLLTRGEVSVMIPLASGRERRLATFSAGMSFGEMAALERSTRSATIYADEEVDCRILSLGDLSRVWEEQPRIKAAMLENLALDLSGKLRKMNRVVSTLAI
jgi:glutaminase